MQNHEFEMQPTPFLEQPTLAAFGLQVNSTMTTPSRPGKKPRPVWVVSGNVFGLEDFFRDIRGRKFRSAWSFFEDPRESILGHLKSHGRLSFAEQIGRDVERKIEKAERYKTYAAYAEIRAERRDKVAHEISSAIPFGQPILIGHVRFVGRKCA